MQLLHSNVLEVKLTLRCGLLLPYLSPKVFIIVFLTFIFQQKIKTDEYDSLSSFLADVRLIFDNTQLFFEPSSSEYQQAMTLEASFTQTLKEYGFGAESESDSDSVRSPTELTLRIPKSHLHPGSITSSSATASSTTPASTNLKVPSLKINLSSSRPDGKALAIKGGVASSSKTTRSHAWIQDFLSSNDPVKMYLAAVYNYHDPATGDFTAEPFLQLPSRTQYPDYYRVIVQPMDLLTIRSNTEVLYRES